MGTKLVDYPVLAVKQAAFEEINLSDPFFDSFRSDYLRPPFDDWFRRKSDDTAYICLQDDSLTAFLFLNREDEAENYSDIVPPLAPKKRLKIGTFKVVDNGYKIGERFLKIIFDNALKQKVTEIYVTLFDKTQEQQRLISLLEKWGLVYHGIKTTQNGEEKVYVKDFAKGQPINPETPKLTYPFTDPGSDVYFVSIYPEYHTDLFPDSILRTESSKDFVENEPHRNALSKVYISRSVERNLKSGDLMVFYRTGGVHKGVVTTVGIVESVVADIRDEAHFSELCRKRSVFSDEQLKLHWDYNRHNRPFIVNFLYLHSFKKRPTLKWLNENGIIPDVTNMPRGFHKISRADLNKIKKYSAS